MGHHHLDVLDKRILSLIADDARMPFLEVARACNVSGAAIHQRIQKLTNLGIIKGSQFTLDPDSIGFETCAFIGLHLNDPLKSDEVVKKLKDIPEIAACYCPTGQYDLFVKVYAYNNQHLTNIIREQLQPLGLSGSETMITLTTPFDRQLPVSMMKVDDESEPYE